MFNKKFCDNCKEKIKASYEFCPTCGNPLKTNSKKKYGMLGKRDNIDGSQNMFEGMGGLSGGILNKMMGSAMKMLEKEMNKEFGMQNPQNKNSKTKTKIKLMINGKEVTPKMGIKEGLKKDKIKRLPIEFSKDNLNKFKKLSKKEPKTKVRRIGDKLTYELEIPGVKSINDVAISKMEEGIEIKAVADKKAYFKNIQINLPLMKYVLSKGTLSLELDTRE